MTSPAYRIATTIIPSHRTGVEQEAVERGLLHPNRIQWRQEQARAELIGGLLLARSAGLSWPDVCRLVRDAAVELGRSLS